MDIKIKLILPAFLAIMHCISCNALVQNDKDERNSYHLKFGGIDKRSISVVAKIQLKGNTLNMVSRPERFIPDIKSWWDLITIYKMEDDKGKLVRIVNITGNQAKLDREVIGKLTIKYSVDISYMDKKYPNLNTAIGKSFDKGFFIVGKPLFIFGDSKLKVDVQVSKSEKVKVSVPWQKKNTVFSAMNLREFVLSNVIVSEYVTEVKDFSIGALSYSLACFDLNKKSIDMIQKTAEDIAAYYVNTFPMIQDMRYVQLIYGVPGLNGGGEAYPYSSASAISEKGIENSIFWKITVFHELFHMWNSHMLKGVAGSADMEWFQEGFTDYMTENVLLKTNHVSQAALLNYQRRNFNNLKRAFERNKGKVSIKSSGNNKGRNFRFVYNGGWLIAKWLNKRLRAATDDAWNMERLFRELFEKYPQNGKVDLTFENLLKEVSEIDVATSRDMKILLNATDWSVINNYVNY